jgi:hypothetical protein
VDLQNLPFGVKAIVLFRFPTQRIEKFRAASGRFRLSDNLSASVANQYHLVADTSLSRIFITAHGISRAPLPRLYSLDKSELFKELQGSVDGGDPDSRVFLAYDEKELFGRKVTIGTIKGIDDDPTCQCHSYPFPLKRPLGTGTAPAESSSISTIGIIHLHLIDNDYQLRIYNNRNLKSIRFSYELFPFLSGP